MNRLPPQTLKAVDFEKSEGKIDLATTGDSVTYDVGAWDNFLVQLPIASPTGVWSAGQTIAVLSSLGDADFLTHGGLSPITTAEAAAGVCGPIAVSGFKQVRLAVVGGSGTAGANMLKPIVRAYQDP